MGRRRTVLLLESVLAVGVAVTALSLVVIPLLGQGGLGLTASAWQPFGEPLHVPARMTAPVVDGLPAGQYPLGQAVELSGPTVATASIENPTVVQRFELLGADVIAGLATVAVLVLLLRITRTLRDDVFVTQNARRLHAVAALVLLGGMLSQALRLAGAYNVMSAAVVRGQAKPVFHLSYVPALVALGIAVLAETFRQGAAMREDVEGLV